MAILAAFPGPYTHKSSIVQNHTNVPLGIYNTPLQVNSAMKNIIYQFRKQVALYLCTHTNQKYYFLSRNLRLLIILS